ncbi:hypothetical protein RJ639_015961 [Escallonia herrerae]|uniref:F-box domain-containing protein n=1 Tax=Escallonia herrerae TaxID=1293975 RepID=A0AA89AN16_9ASTE|nr:hypothetical protein RJ639_015961 [Escallonia herrerae]
MERSLQLCRYPKAVGVIEDLWIEDYRYKLREERSVAARKKEQEDKEDDQPITLQGLPGDLVVSEIVSRLPVRLLSRFRCVCKAWRSLLSNPSFQKKMPNLRHKVLIQSAGDRFYSIDYEASDWNVVPLDFPNHEIGQPYYNPSVSSVGSCNGWVCVDIHRRASESTILVWNPLTGHYKSIPDSGRDPSHRRDIGFGYDSCADDYFVVRMYTKRTISVDVYMLKRNSWEKIEVVPGLIEANEFVVRDLAVNGSVVYILVNGMERLASFDLKDGKFRDVPFPDDLSGAEGQLGLDVFEGCLAAVEWSREKPQGQVWQLKQESSNTTLMKQVWVKHSELTLASTFDVPFRFARYGKVVGLSRSGRRYDLVICDGNKKKTARIIGLVSTVKDMWTYVENPFSLQSLLKEDVASDKYLGEKKHVYTFVGVRVHSLSVEEAENEYSGYSRVLDNVVSTMGGPLLKQVNSNGEPRREFDSLSLRLYSSRNGANGLLTKSLPGYNGSTSGNRSAPNLQTRRTKTMAQNSFGQRNETATHRNSDSPSSTTRITAMKKEIEVFKTSYGSKGKGEYSQKVAHKGIHAVSRDQLLR